MLVREELRALLTDPALIRTLQNPFVGTVFPFAAGVCTLAADVSAGTFGSGSGCSPGTYTFLANSASTVPLISKGASSQTGDLQQWQKSDGRVYAGVKKDGTIYTPGEAVGAYLMPTGGSGNSFRFGLGNNLYWDGSTWRAVSDGSNNGGAAIITDNGNGALQFYAFNSTASASDQTISNSTFNAAERMRLTAAGSLGIGTSSPTEKLDVIGNVKSDGLNKIVFLRPTGSNDGTAINTAISNLPSDGGIIYLMPGNWSINTTININKNGVKLRGYGSALPGPLTKLVDAGAGTVVSASAPRVTATVTGATNANPIQITTSASNPFITGDVVFISGVNGNTNANGTWTITRIDSTHFTLDNRSGNANYTSGGTVTRATSLEDLEISDLAIDGNSGSATVGLLLDGVLNSRIRNLSIYNLNYSSGVGLKLLVTTNITLSWNIFERITVISAWKGLLLDSVRLTGAANPAHNTFISTNVQSINKYGIELGDCDNNSFQMVTTPGPGGTYAGAEAGVLVDLDIHSVGAQPWARSNYFYHLQAGGQKGLVGINAEDPEGSYQEPKNLVFGYDYANAEPPPEVYTSSNFSTPITNHTLSDYFYWVDSFGRASTRFFSQNSRPTLFTNELANWYRPDDGKNGMLYFDGTNYWWWRAADDGTVIAEANP